MGVGSVPPIPVIAWEERVGVPVPDRRSCRRGAGNAPPPAPPPGAWLRPQMLPARGPPAKRRPGAGLTLAPRVPRVPPISERPVGHPQLPRPSPSRRPLLSRIQDGGIQAKGSPSRSSTVFLRPAAVAQSLRRGRRRGRRPRCRWCHGHPRRAAASPFRIQIQLQGAAPGAERRDRALLGPRGE